MPKEKVKTRERARRRSVEDEDKSEEKKGRRGDLKEQRIRHAKEKHIEEDGFRARKESGDRLKEKESRLPKQYANNKTESRTVEQEERMKRRRARELVERNEEQDSRTKQVRDKKLPERNAERESRRVKETEPPSKHAEREGRVKRPKEGVSSHRNVEQDDRIKHGREKVDPERKGRGEPVRSMAAEDMDLRWSSREERKERVVEGRTSHRRVKSEPESLKNRAVRQGERERVESKHRDGEGRWPKREEHERIVRYKGEPIIGARESERSRREVRANDSRTQHLARESKTEKHKSHQMKHNDDSRDMPGKKTKHQKAQEDKPMEVEGKEDKMEWQDQQESAPEQPIDPQEVPRKGFFFEHDNRDTYVPQRLRPVPPWKSQLQERTEFLEKRQLLNNPNPRTWREREEHDWGRSRDARDRLMRRHSSGEQYFTRGGRGVERRRRTRDHEDWEDRESSRMELVSSRWSDNRRRKRIERRGEDGEQTTTDRSPTKWKHDLYEDEDNATTQPTQAQEEGGEGGGRGDKSEKRKTWSSGWEEGDWEHDKYEELIKVDPDIENEDTIKTETETAEIQRSPEQ